MERRRCAHGASEDFRRRRSRLRRRQARPPQAVGDPLLMSAFGYRKPADLPQTIALFPLNGAILFPRGVLALNIFEPRYLNMIDDALGAERMIGIIQPATGEEDEAVPELSD